MHCDSDQIVTNCKMTPKQTAKSWRSVFMAVAATYLPVVPKTGPGSQNFWAKIMGYVSEAFRRAFGIHRDKKCDSVVEQLMRVHA